MAVIALTSTDLQAGGTTTVYTGSLSTSNTYTFANDGKVFLHFKKTGAGACTVTIVTPGTVSGLAVADQTITVPATTGDVMVGKLSSDLFTDPATGLATMSFSEITGLSVGVFHT